MIASLNRARQLPSERSSTDSKQGADEIHAAICSLFGESQHSSASHRKNVHAFRRLLQQCAGDAAREEQLLVSVVHCLTAALAVKRGDEVANRLVRFLAGSVVFIADKCDGGAEERFIENLMLFCLEHVDAKDRVVRARLAQLMVACLNAVDELSDSVWGVFRVKMTERLFDKEAAVRVHAVHAMSRLQGLALSEEGSLDVMDIFLDLLQHDPSADVRRAVLTQIDVCPRSLPLILERRRDVDAGIRRHFYAFKMHEVDLKTLTIAQRDDILKTGLADREESVRQACAEMIFSSWIQRTNSNLIEGAEAVQEMLPELTCLVQHVRRFYEYLVAVQDEVARTDIEFILCQLLAVVEMCDFGDEVGRRLLADALEDVLTNLEVGEAVLEAAIRVLAAVTTKGGDFMAKIGELVASFRDVYEQPTEADDLHRSLESLDINSSLPEDLCIMANLKALEIVRHALCVASISRLEPSLIALLDAVVIPSVNSPFAAIQAAGLRCLGLYGTISKVCSALHFFPAQELATEYMPLMVDFFLLGQGEVRATSLQSLFDWFTLHGISNDSSSSARKSPLDTAIRSLYDPDPAIQCISAEGFSRLLLHRVHRDPQILEGLLHLYFHPSTEAQPRLRQCLSYFLPAFALSAVDNQQLMRQVVPSVLHTWMGTVKTIDGALPLSSVAAQLLHFSDPSNLIVEHQEANPFAALGMHRPAMLCRLCIGVELCWRALSDPTESPLCAIIAKLPVDASCPELRRLFYLLGVLMRFNGNAALKKFVGLLVELGGSEALPAEEVAALQERVKRALPLGMSTLPTTTAPAAVSQRKPQGRPRKPANVGNILDELENFDDDGLE